MSSEEEKKAANEQANDDDPSKSVHSKARSSPYVNTQQKRFTVPDAKVAWKCDFAEYQPPFFTHPTVANHKLPDANLATIKADKTDKIRFKFNAMDGKIDRRSHVGTYALDASNFNLPLNPLGRTGLRGRGWLWRWGPNHAADPIVTRWMRKDNDASNEIVKDETTQKPVLEFVAIERTDGGGWAIPGGMVDPGEQVSRTLKREFGEETMDTLGMKDESARKKVKQQVDEFFQNNGVEIYKGYVDDPRNTDNAWMETVAFNFHDEEGDKVGRFQLKAGDDASKVKWMKIDRQLNLYASHNWLIKRAVELHGAHW
eukprot:CAMPEP_0197057956 /NCGR_PEP_ID=MMETSP1384-20130603/102554_1 /TAXON_ID=29189 /ORGANISM="Ammonia sp." /LENGTH=313 /DNA_ID=CAMNT_0042492539 /DNA_START=109 /DNA_END=1050 /DNA_ORIENTATION=+